jgi:HSP20 family molecular chaperone IbpA
LDEETAMATERTQGLQARENRELAGTAEATRPGALLTPLVDIFEDPQAITLVADMPGVKSSDLSIDLHEGILTVTGHGEGAEGPNESTMIREFPAGTFRRSFSLSEAIDQTKIEAALKNGVLRLRLPKVERAKPRQISIQSD